MPSAAILLSATETDPEAAHAGYRTARPLIMPGCISVAATM